MASKTKDNSQKVVNVKELAARFVKRCEFEISKREAIEEINLITELITEAIANGDTVKLREFGLTTSYRGPKSCKNPRTGEMQEIPAHYGLRIKTFKAMKDKLTAMEPPKTKSAKTAAKKAEPKKAAAKAPAKASTKPAAKTKGGKKK